MLVSHLVPCADAILRVSTYPSHQNLSMLLLLLLLPCLFGHVCDCMSCRSHKPRSFVMHVLPSSPKKDITFKKLAAEDMCMLHLGSGKFDIALLSEADKEGDLARLHMRYGAANVVSTWPCPAILSACTPLPQHRASLGLPSEPT